MSHDQPLRAGLVCIHPLTLLVSVGQRFHFPQETKERLEEVYTSVAPDAKYGDEVASVAAELGLEVPRVKKWFDNRRRSGPDHPWARGAARGFLPLLCCFFLLRLRKTAFT